MAGLLMAVPGHDQRDFDFAEAHGLPVIRVVGEKASDATAELTQAFEGGGVAVNSGRYDGLPTPEVHRRIIAELEGKGHGNRRVEYKLRDWVFSRQRYWGEPIPISFPVELEDPTGNPRKGAKYTIRFDQPIPLDRSELPLRLPELDHYQPGEDPAGPLARAMDWRFFQKDGRWYARETNTMPQWAGSCWYYLRFIDPKNGQAPCDPELAARWLPVDLYVGGAEHAVLHLLYARFWHKVLFDAGLVKGPEPFKKLVHQGMILGEVEHTTYRDASGQYVSREHVGEALDETGEERPVDQRTLGFLTPQKVAAEAIGKKGGDFVLAENEAIVVDARAHKMSKSRGNVVNPDAIVGEHGADALRVYEMFLGPLEATKPWSTRNIQGPRRFLDRAFELSTRVPSEAPPPPPLLRHLHRAIRKVGDDIESLRFNTAISTLMGLRNELSPLEHPPRFALETFTLLLHPFAPHLAEELWETLGRAPSIQREPWPTYDPALCVDEELEIPVQVNGKVRGQVRVAADATEAAVVEAALKDERVLKHTQGKALVSRRYVPGRILSLLVE